MVYNQNEEKSKLHRLTILEFCSMPESPTYTEIKKYLQKKVSVKISDRTVDKNIKKLLEEGSLQKNGKKGYRTTKAGLSEKENLNQQVMMSRKGSIKTIAFSDLIKRNDDHSGKISNIDCAGTVWLTKKSKSQLSQDKLEDDVATLVDNFQKELSEVAKKHSGIGTIQINQSIKITNKQSKK